MGAQISVFSFKRFAEMFLKVPFLLLFKFSISLDITSSCALIYQPLLKNTTPSFLPSPLLNLQTV